MNIKELCERRFELSQKRIKQHGLSKEEGWELYQIDGLLGSYGMSHSPHIPYQVKEAFKELEDFLRERQKQ